MPPPIYLYNDLKQAYDNEKGKGQGQNGNPMEDHNEMLMTKVKSKFKDSNP